MTDISAIKRAVLQEGDVEALLDLHKALGARIRDLQRQQLQQRAVAVEKGVTVRLDHMKPKYLNGLTGVVTAFDGHWARVELDEGSTRTLAFHGARRFEIGPEVEHFTITVPPMGLIVEPPPQQGPNGARVFEEPL